MMELKKYVKRRNEILLSLDVEKMKKIYAEIGGSSMPDDDNVVLAGMHYARLEVTSFSDEIKAESLGWLHANNYIA